MSATQTGRRFLVTGGAGFIGSHLCETLLASGGHVTVVDDLSTGRHSNLHAAHAMGGGRIELIESTVSAALPVLAERHFDVICLTHTHAASLCEFQRGVRKGHTHAVSGR